MKYEYLYLNGYQDLVCRVEEYAPTRFLGARKQFYRDGEWQDDDDLWLYVNDCIMNYGGCSDEFIDHISEEKAMSIIAEQDKAKK